MGQEELRQLEGNSAAGEATLRVAAVGALRIDDREGWRQLRRDAVMVRHEDVDPGRARLADLGKARRPAVDRHDHASPGLQGRRDCLARQPVALVEAARDVRDGVDAQPSERPYEDGQAGQPVGVEVAEDEDPFATAPGGRDPFAEQARVRQERRVMKRLERIGEERVEVGR